MTLLRYSNESSVNSISSSFSVTKEKEFDSSLVLQRATKPKFLMEELSRPWALITLRLPYIIFIVCFIYDVYELSSNFSRPDRHRTLNTKNCTSIFQQSCNEDHACFRVTSKDIFSWYGHVSNIDNVVAFKLRLNIDNFTNWFDYNTPYNSNNCYFNYNININVFKKYSHNMNNNCLLLGKNISDGYDVLEYSGSFEILDGTTRNGDLKIDIIPYIYQNQETIATQSLIEYYNIAVDYTIYDNNNGIPIPINYTIFDQYLNINDLSHEFIMLDRNKSQKGFNIFSFILMGITFFFTLFFIFQTNKDTSNGEWLPEQSWVIIMMFGLLLYQNVFFIYLNLNGTDVDGYVTLAFLSFFIDAMGQSILFMIWLCFTYSTKRYITTFWNFYVPWLMYGLILFLSNIIMLSLYFPTLFTDGDRGPFESFMNWSIESRSIYMFSSLTFSSLVLLWIPLWFICLYFSFKQLWNLPYTETRFLQLSHRYFCIQGWLIAVYFVNQLVLITIYAYVGGSYGSRDDAGSVNWDDTDSFLENTAILFRLSLNQKGRMIFLTLYTFQLAFLLLPANYGKDGRILYAFIDFAIDDNEAKRIMIEKSKLINYSQVFTSIVYPQLYSIESALLYLELSAMAYRDPIYKKTRSSLTGTNVINVNEIMPHYQYIDYGYDPSNECFYFITYDSKKEMLIISFRGTNSEAHWSSNLKYNVKEFTNESQIFKDENYTNIFSEIKMKNIIEKNSKYIEYLRNSLRMNGGWGPINTSKRKINRLIDNTLTALYYRSMKAVYETVESVKSCFGTAYPRFYNLHTGFLDLYKSSRNTLHNKIIDFCQKNPPGHVKNICFTGHSLGGALATLAALDFSMNVVNNIDCFYYNLNFEKYNDNLKNNSDEKIKKYYINGSNSLLLGGNKDDENLNALIHISLYTFGQPKVGNDMFGKLLKKYVPHYYRTVVYGDIVPQVPPKRWGYKTLGIEALLDSKGKSLLVDPSPLDKFLRNRKISHLSVSKHSLETYRFALSSVRDNYKYGENPDSFFSLRNGFKMIQKNISTTTNCNNKKSNTIEEIREKDFIYKNHEDEKDSINNRFPKLNNQNLSKSLLDSKENENDINPLHSILEKNNFNQEDFNEEEVQIRHSMESSISLAEITERNLSVLVDQEEKSWTIKKLFNL